MNRQSGEETERQKNAEMDVSPQSANDLSHYSINQLISCKTNDFTLILICFGFEQV